MSRASPAPREIRRHAPFVLPPPPSAEVFRSNDVDEVREHVEKRDGSHLRVVHRAGPCGYVSHALLARDAGMVSNRVGLAQTIRSALAALAASMLASAGHALRRRRSR